MGKMIVFELLFSTSVSLNYKYHVLLFFTSLCIGISSCFVYNGIFMKSKEELVKLDVNLLNYRRHNESVNA